MSSSRARATLGLMALLLALGGAGPAHTIDDHDSLTWAAAASVGGDWPMFQSDPAHSGANLAETTITAANASTLQLAWVFATPKAVVTSPVTANGVLYVGSWNGYEYAVSIATHQQLWKQFVGTTTQASVQNCYGRPVGVSSSAAVVGGVLYVGGGDGYLYALDASTGAVLWKSLIGSPPYYNWSSPLVYNGRVYVGAAAYCDPPNVRGEVLAFNISDGSLAASVSLVPAGSLGATVWSSPALDPAGTRLYVTTGNNAGAPLAKELNAEAFLALDPTTLAILDRWQIPLADRPSNGDADFGASPILFDVNGVGYIGALNKNGIVYVLNRSNLAAGPVWKAALGGTPLTSSSRLSSACFANGTLYVGSGPINGTTYGGTVAAFQADTGVLRWQVFTATKMFSPVTCISDLIVDGTGTSVEVRKASTGAVLFSYSTGKAVQGASIISDGVLYTPSKTGSVYAFAPAS